MNKPLRLANATEIKQWDNLLGQNPYGAEPYQTRSFAAIKQKQGWKPEYWVYSTKSGAVYALALIRKLSGLGRVVYIPRGPSVVEPKQWSEVCSINRQQLTDVIALKMEPPILAGKLKVIRDDVKKVRDIQGSVVNTVVINLDQNEDALWDSFRQRARRSIRGGRREQLKISEGAFSPKNVDLLWGLYRETAARAGLKIRSRAYYENFWREYTDRGHGRFFFAWTPDGKQPIAGLFVCYVGDKALYKDGGSKRDAKAHFSHLLQWETMRYLQQKGVRYYDLGGTPPTGQINDSSHRLASLATFKLSFGAPITEHIGAYDQILKPRLYKAWLFVERLHRAVASHTKYRDLY
ncbi:peptidoglycan bridge formation glycyltransferase FemA/FemB family protein [Candidatus Saccharibacteria bacterium]|nr:MAG: peptidoglycan bridge formation glycyltransferase FemA/FemB family protein [Candidatus Saccharibacteria bacterium]